MAKFKIGDRAALTDHLDTRSPNDPDLLTMEITGTNGKTGPAEYLTVLYCWAGRSPRTGREYAEDLTLLP